MVKSESHIPKIRFDGFSDVWNSVIIDELVNKKIIDKPMDGNHGEIHPTSDDYVDDGISFVMANDILNGQLHLEKSKKISYELSKTLRKGFAQEGDILLTHKATIGETAIVPKLNNPYIVLTPQVTYYRILQQNKLNRYFLKSNFQSPSFVKCLQQAVTGATRLYIGITEQRSLKLNLTTIQEQTQIGNFFQKIDQVIELQQKALDIARNYKKSMLQKMFPKKGEKVPQIRFDGFSGEWDKKNLSQITKINPSTDLPDDFYYVDLESVKASRLIGYRDESKITAPSRAQRLAKKGDVFYQTVRPYQKNNYLFNFNEDNYVFSTGYAQLRPLINTDSAFVFAQIQSEKFVNNVLERCTGTSYPAINSTDLSLINLYVPMFEEQQKIGEFFQKLDQQIEQHEKKLESYQNLKKAMLQRMFV